MGNLVDGLLTFALLTLELADEANPVMEWLYEVSPVSFIAGKLGGVSLATLLLWAHRHLFAAQLALGAGALVYSGIVTYHLAVITLLNRLMNG